MLDAATGAHVASIFAPGPGMAHWYTPTGAGRAADRYEALDKIKKHMGIAPDDKE